VTVSTATLQWSRQVPVPAIPDQAAPAGPVTTLRATSYVVASSFDGRTWQAVANVDQRSSGPTDVLHFAPTQARFISVRISASAAGQPPMLVELTVT
jgi:hypothetical protein